MTDLPSHRDHEGAIETGFPQTPPVVIVHAVTEFIGKYPLRHPLKVWRDPSDSISALRIVTLMCLFAPLSKVIYDSDAMMRGRSLS